MARYPRSSPMVDLLRGETLVDPVPARASLLLDVDARQHAAITAYGCPVQTWGLTVAAASPETHYLPLRLCGVRYASLGLLVAGYGSATITTAADAIGVTLSWRGVGVTASWVYTLPSRPLEVWSSATRQWATELAEMVITPDGEARVLGVALFPHHVPM